MFSRNKKWNTKSEKEKKEFMIPKRFWIYLVLIIACGVGVIHILRLPEYQIKDIAIQGGVITKDRDVESVAQEYLGYKYFYFIPQSNIWLYPKAKILERIRSITSVSSVGMDLDKERVLHIYLKDKDNKFILCQTLNGNCFYMNEEGYAFSKAPEFEGNAFLTFRTRSTDDLLGTYFLTKTKIGDILDFISKLKVLEIEVVAVDIKNENEISFELSSGALLILSLDKDLNETIISIRTLLNSKEFMDKSGGFEGIDYIDLRYGKKAFWKAEVLVN